MARTALVTGATGFLGRQVVKAFERAEWKVVGTGWSRAKPPAIVKLDLTDDAAVQGILDEIKPDVVVHCAAHRFPDQCVSDPTGTQALNVQATGTLAAATAARSTLLIYVSSDYVFPGVPGEAPYRASATPRPPNFYGETKYAGEQAVLSATRAAAGLAVVLRVPVLYGAANEPKESAINVLLDAVWAAQQPADPAAPVAMDDWAIRYPTNTEDVARVIRHLATLYLDRRARAATDDDPTPAAALPRILQFSSEDGLTKYQICQMLAEILAVPLAEDRMVPSREGNSGAPDAVPRPYDCHLSTAELRELGVAVDCVGFRDWWRRELKAYRR
ncbi:MAG: hypothetical protein M1826_001817 [Phylliscum demangeonii]|nr:MAG: hypothetical protein M1826_001817 [Phylliscum demangeonii]